MPVPPLPPLRVREADNSPNVIPVFEIVCSNGTLTDLGGGKVSLATGTGAQGPAGSGMGINSAVVLGSAGAVLFVSTSQLLQQEESLLFWDEVANRLGVGLSNPAVTLDVTGSARVSGQLILTLDAVSAGHAVRANRAINTTYPLAGGGNFTADRTATVDTAFLVTSARAINTTAPVAGGGNLGADRTITVDTAFLVSTGRTLTAGSGLSGGGDLSADRTFSVTTNVRDKVLGFFAAGTATTVMQAASARVYVPYNMEIRGVYLAVAPSGAGASLLVNLAQYATPMGAAVNCFTAANRPAILTAADNGNSTTLSNNTLFLGSWAGFTIDQVPTTTSAQNLTVTVVLRTS